MENYKFLFKTSFNQLETTNMQLFLYSDIHYWYSQEILESSSVEDLASGQQESNGGVVLTASASRTSSAIFENSLLRSKFCD